MRVTLGMLTNGVRANLMQSAEQLLEAQDQASSGKRIHRPSDDVPGVGRAISLRSALSSIDQFDRNSGVASNLLSVTEDSLTSMVNNLQRVLQLNFKGASDGLNQNAMDGIVTELDGIETELKSSGNTQYLGRYVFSGSLTDAEAIVANPAGAPPYNYQGDDSAFQIQVAPGVYVPANITGDVVFNMGGAASPGIPDMFSTLESLKAKVRAGDVDGVSDLIAEVKQHLGNVSAIRSQVGGRINRLESANQTLQDSKLKVQDLLSKTEDADTAVAIIDLQTRQNAYQAALSVASRILDMSLANTWK